MKQKSERKFYLREAMAISRAILTYEDMNLLLQHLVEGLCRTFGFKGSSIFLYDDKTNELFRISSYGLSNEYIDKGSMSIENQSLTKEPLLYENLKNNSKIKYAEAAIKEGIVSMLSLPVKYKNSFIGLLKIYHSEPILIHGDDIEVIKNILQQLGLVIELNGIKNFINNVKSAVDQLPHYITEGH